jgi:UDP:flavonoid glycosyltransferase YjiC (YdhE family)
LLSLRNTNTGLRSYLANDRSYAESASWDQPDNASRVQRLGVGLHVPRDNYSVATAAQALVKLLGTTHFSDCAAEVRTRLAAEKGLATSCTAIESMFVNKRNAFVH